MATKTTKPLFKYLPGSQTPQQSMVAVQVDGSEVRMSAHASLAAGLLAAGFSSLRRSPVGGGERAPYCMMGVCFECQVEVDGLPSQQACLITPTQGMRVRTMQGAPCTAAEQPCGEARHV